MISLIPMPYRIAAVAILILACILFGYVKGDEHGTQKLTEFVAKEATESTRIAQARTIITEKISDEHAKQDAARDARFNAAVSLLNAYASAKPVSGSATICNDQTADNRLSDAISVHLAEVRRIIADERAAALELFKQAERQTGQLVEGQDWLSQQSQVK